LPDYLSVHVRWPAKAAGAFAFALILFVSFSIKGKRKAMIPASYL
jgi:hypothetical protein